MKDPLVDIIITVHNAPNLVNLCLNSVAQTYNPDEHRIIIIDDGSEAPTSQILTDFIQVKISTVLIKNNTPNGYTKAANQGIRESTAEMIILLNSDTQVSENWIQRIRRTLFETPGVGIVGPLSNAASYQSIPRVEPTIKERLQRQTVVNELPPGMTIRDVNLLLQSITWNHPIRVPLIHGFCFAMRRDVFVEIGYFDEVIFPRGYGEENDFCFRATDAGWGLAIAPDTYIWHEKTGSYSIDIRAELVRHARSALVAKYGKRRIDIANSSLRSTSNYLQSRIGESWNE